MARSTKKSSSTVYKRGKLSKSTRFSLKRINWTPIIIILCLIATFIFAVIFGNVLKRRVEESKNTTTSPNDTSSVIPPSPDRVSPLNKLCAYFVDFSGADPQKSLSELSADSRSKGNALFVEIKNNQNELIYSSEKAQELGFLQKNNLTLSRLENHFDYYNDYAIALFKSDFSASLDIEEALKLQTNEILLLKEATDDAFNEIIIDFSDNITKNNLINYQSYLLNLKLACPDVPVGIKLSVSFLSDSNNAGAIAGLLGIADFFVLNLDQKSADAITSTLAPLVYFTERYDCVMMISGEDEGTLAERIALINDKGIENYIVK